MKNIINIIKSEKDKDKYLWFTIISAIFFSLSFFLCFVVLLIIDIFKHDGDQDDEYDESGKSTPVGVSIGNNLSIDSEGNVVPTKF